MTIGHVTWQLTDHIRPRCCSSQTIMMSGMNEQVSCSIIPTPYASPRSSGKGGVGRVRWITKGLIPWDYKIR